MMEIKTFEFNNHKNVSASLIAIEAYKDIPFEIKRVYYICDVQSSEVRRGFHAHKKLQQVLICVGGSCRIHLDDGRDTAEIELDSPTKGLYIGSDMWREMYDFTPNAVLLVLASEYYNENDYIRDYNDFIKYVKDRR